MGRDRNMNNRQADGIPPERAVETDGQSFEEYGEAPLGFGSEEWDLVKDSPNFPFMLIFDLPGKGFVAHMRELTGYVAVIMKSASRFKDNALVRELIFMGEMNEEHGDSHYENVYEVNESLAQYERQVKSGEIFIRLRELLDSRLSAEDSEGYRDFLIDIAVGMTEVSSEGFLGFGRKVSNDESEALSNLKRWLGR